MVSYPMATHGSAESGL